MNATCKNSIRPQVENLEDRIHPSWGVEPPVQVNFNDNPFPTPPSGGIQIVTGNDQVRINRFNTAGNYQTTASISDNEIDYYSFVAQRNGVYKFDAQALKNYSIDTVAGVFAADGKRLAYNDDASGTTRDSSFTANLLAGKTYVLGVTNLRGSPNGAYRASITAPRLQVFDDEKSRSAHSWGHATLEGTRLSLFLEGRTTKNFGKHSHRIEVKILDGAGQPIHTGSFWLRLRTAGRLVWRGAPTYDTHSWTWDVSNLDLSRASRLSIWVTHI